MTLELKHEEPTRGKGFSRMARTKRQYGSGCLLKRGKGWAIRWRELEIAPDGKMKRVLRFETLDEISRKEANEILGRKVAAATGARAPTRSRVRFENIAHEWQAHVLPMYKASTQKNHRHIMGKHLLPQFGERPISDLTRQEVQAYVAMLTQAGYAPKSVDHIHDVLSAVLRTAVKWGHLQDNPAIGVDLPTIRTVRSKWVLTIRQAADLLAALAPLARTMAGLAMLTGLRRGELFALRWKDVDETGRCLTVKRGGLRGGVRYAEDRCGLSGDSVVGRRVPSGRGVAAKGLQNRTRGTLVRDVVGQGHFAEQRAAVVDLPACAALELPRATWLTSDARTRRGHTTRGCRARSWLS